MNIPRIFTAQNELFPDFLPFFLFFIDGLFIIFRITVIFRKFPEIGKNRFPSADFQVSR